MKIELDYIEKLVEMVSEKELTELTVEDGEQAVIIRKEKEIITAATTTMPVSSVAAQQQVTQQSAPAQEESKKEESSNLVKITSPMVGTFYKSPSPGAAPFTEVGKTVNSGQVVCIIEAMKLMNEIESEVSGKVAKICVEDGQPVEFGQTLMLIEP